MPKRKKPKTRAKPTGPFLCYVLREGKGGGGRVYTGITNNWVRRLRQHCTGRGGARYTKGAKAGWRPLFHVLGFQSHRRVLQFEYAMKRRRIPSSKTKTRRVRGCSGRCRQLEYILSCTDKDFRSGLRVKLFVTREKYLRLSHLSPEEFEARRKETGVQFEFK